MLEGPSVTRGSPLHASAHMVVVSVHPNIYVVLLFLNWLNEVWWYWFTQNTSELNTAISVLQMRNWDRLTPYLFENLDSQDWLKKKCFTNSTSFYAEQYLFIYPFVYLFPNSSSHLLCPISFSFCILLHFSAPVCRCHTDVLFLRGNLQNETLIMDKHISCYQYINDKWQQFADYTASPDVGFRPDPDFFSENAFNRHIFAYDSTILA